LTRAQWATIGAISALIAGVVIFKADLGFLATTLALILALVGAADQEAAFKAVPWETIIMVCGVSVLVAIVEHTGGLDLFTALLALSLHELIDQLPEPYRQALILTEYQGLSQKQLAERIGISLSGAKSRVQRAREKLRDMLLRCCHFEFDRRGHIVDYYQRCCCCHPVDERLT
jgi:hypothetical protein